VENGSHTVQTVDGRTLELLLAGPRDGEVLLFHHGTPGAAVLHQPLVDAAAAQGLRTVLYSRPGYGRSTPHHGRRVADAAADSRTVLDAVDADRFVTLGWSGGGPHALACAALLGDRCRAAAVIAGVAPLEGSPEEWTAGMGEDNVAEFSAALRGADALKVYLAADAEGLQVATRDVLAAMTTLMSPVDVAAMSGSTGDYLAALMRHALLQGADGWLDDDLAFVTSWGLNLADIAVPVALWQGAEDLMVPHRHGTLLAGDVPSSQVHFVPGHGHLTLIADPAEVVGELVDMGRPR
jgi:pimeloyl-ACP methyl ester carboxylesterase